MSGKKFKIERKHQQMQDVFRAQVHQQQMAHLYRRTPIYLAIRQALRSV